MVPSDLQTCFLTWGGFFFLSLQISTAQARRRDVTASLKRNARNTTLAPQLQAQLDAIDTHIRTLQSEEAALQRQLGAQRDRRKLAIF
jgi:N-glycosylase/DNA lyase